MKRGFQRGSREKLLLQSTSGLTERKSRTALSSARPSKMLRALNAKWDKSGDREVRHEATQRQAGAIALVLCYTRDLTCGARGACGRIFQFNASFVRRGGTEEGELRQLRRETPDMARCVLAAHL